MLLDGSALQHIAVRCVNVMHNKRKKFLCHSQTNIAEFLCCLRALLVKLYYHNDENAAAALRKFRRLEIQRRGPMSEQALRDMMVKFVRTERLGVLLRRGMKRVRTTIVEDVATAVVEASGESLRGTVGV